MATVPRQNPRVKAIQRINKSLEGPVMEILRDLLPEVKALPRQNTVHYIMDDLGLLARCFIAYREHPERFRKLLVAPRQGGEVRSAQDPLSCGRSFDQVVGIIVRTAAKRHFQQSIDGDTRPFRGGKYLTADEMNMVQLVFSVFGQKYARPSKQTKGQKLYEAFGENIRYDWQIPLVPEYAALPLPVVQTLGEHILDYKLASEIRQLRQDPDHPPAASTLVPRPLFVPPPAVAEPEAPPPAPVAEAPPVAALSGQAKTGERAELTELVNTAKAPSDRRAKLDEILTGDGKRLNGRAFTNLLLDPVIQALLPQNLASIRVGDTLNQVNGTAAKHLVNTLGLRQDQLAVLMICAQQSFGELVFGNLFGAGCQLDALSGIISQMQELGLTQDTPLEEVAAMAKAKFLRPPPAVKSKF